MLLSTAVTAMVRTGGEANSEINPVIERHRIRNSLALAAQWARPSFLWRAAQSIPSLPWRGTRIDDVMPPWHLRHDSSVTLLLRPVIWISSGNRPVVNASEWFNLLSAFAKYLGMDHGGVWQSLRTPARRKLDLSQPSNCPRMTWQVTRAPGSPVMQGWPLAQPKLNSANRGSMPGAATADSAAEPCSCMRAELSVSWIATKET